jgi:glycosyltransferase involved in cell wall biosynthesis
MRVLLISHACVVDTNRDRLVALAQQESLRLTLLTVRTWRDRDSGRVFRFVPSERAPYGWRTGVAFPNWHPVAHAYLHGLRGAICACDPDVVHLDEDFYALATFQTAWLTRKHRARLVLFNFQNIPRALPWPVSAMTQYSLRRGDAAIAGGFGAADVLRQAGFDGPIEVIPPGLDERRYRPMDASALRAQQGLDAFTIGYVGRLVPEKGLMALLQAATRLQGRWHLYVVGGGPLLEDLRAEALRLGVADRVVFAGQVPHRDIPRHMACADVIAVPSETTSRWKEQFGRTIIEAMACGKPVVGSDSGEIPLVIRDDGLVFPERDVEALAACLQRLMDDPALRRELSERGRTRVLENYTWAKNAERTKAVYEMVLSKG